MSVLVGRNNSGKTTILEALGILFQVLEKPIPISRKSSNLNEVTAFVEVQFTFEEKDWIKITEMVKNEYPDHKEQLDLDKILNILIKSPIRYRWISRYSNGKHQTGMDQRTFTFVDAQTLKGLNDSQSTIIYAALDKLLYVNLSKYLGVIYLSSERSSALNPESFTPFDRLISLNDSERAQFIRTNLYHLKQTAVGKYDFIIEIIKRVFTDVTHVDSYLNENTGKVELNFKILLNAQFVSFFPFFAKVLAFRSKVPPGIRMNSKNFATLVLYLSLVTGDLIAFRNNLHGSSSDSSIILVFLKSFLTILFVKPT